MCNNVLKIFEGLDKIFEKHSKSYAVKVTLEAQECSLLRLLPHQMVFPKILIAQSSPGVLKFWNISFAITYGVEEAVLQFVTVFCSTTVP